MKAFYGESSTAGERMLLADAAGGDSSTYIDTHARVAVYDSPSAAPYVEDIGPAPVDTFIESLTVRVYELSRQRGGTLPYTVIREVAENLIHAGFAEPVVSILDSGNTVRFTDQGPGIPDKVRALQPGFTTAHSYMKNVIRGVGSGLPIVSDFINITGGTLLLEDNLTGGTVVTVSSLHGRSEALTAQASRQKIPPTTTVTPGGPVSAPGVPATRIASEASTLFGDETPTDTSARLTTRQKQVMALVLESGSAGPSVVSRELGVGLSTAYRDLASLEDLGLIVSDGGKRRLTDEGLSLLGGLSSTTDHPFL